MKINLLKTKNKDILLKSFLSGLGWMAGATFGFTLLLALLNRLGGLPIVGDWIARLISVTNQAMESKRSLP